jgi:hypothetical protein
MNKISLYVFLVLLYLGLSKGLSPSEQKNEYIVNSDVLAASFQGSPISVILLDTFQAGLVIKTYYLKIKLVKVFQSPKIIVVRTTKQYWKEVRNFTGMSIFRRDNNLVESMLPLPPGSLFIGHSGFGKWVFADSGERVWKFHKAYRNYPRLLLWGDFRPTQKFLKVMNVYIKNNEPFHGLNDEFGINGELSKKSLSLLIDQTRQKHITLKEHLKKYIAVPSWNNKGT